MKTFLLTTLFSLENTPYMESRIEWAAGKGPLSSSCSFKGIEMQFEYPTEAEANKVKDKILALGRRQGVELSVKVFEVP